MRKEEIEKRSDAWIARAYKQIADELIKLGWKVGMDDDQFYCFTEAMTKKEDYLVFDSVDELNGFLCGVSVCKGQASAG
jgi:hypothetical protein